MKLRIEADLARRGRDWGEVKSGAGSIRDIEFVTQFLQLAYGGQAPQIRSINTLDGLVRLADFSWIHADEYRRLVSAYSFFRTIEHSLQLMYYKQTHSLPEDRRELAFLARRLDFADADQFLDHYDRHRASVRAIYRKYMEGKTVIYGPDDSVEAAPDCAFAAAQSNRPTARRLPRPKLSPCRAVCGIFSEETPCRGRCRRACGGTLASDDCRIQPSGRAVEHLRPSLRPRLQHHRRERLFGGANGRRSNGNRPPACRRFRKLSGQVRRCVYGRTGGTPQDRPVASRRDYAAELAGLIREVRCGHGREAQGRLAKRVAGAMPDQAEPATTLYPVEIAIDNKSSPRASVLRSARKTRSAFSTN